MKEEEDADRRNLATVAWGAIAGGKEEKKKELGQRRSKIRRAEEWRRRTSQSGVVRWSSRNGAGEQRHGNRRGGEKEDRRDTNWVLSPDGPGDRTAGAARKTKATVVMWSGRPDGVQTTAKRSRVS
jgi:hypothetical protein